METRRGQGECPSVVSRSAFSTPAGKFGAGRLSLHYREMHIWGKEVWEEEAWGPKRVLHLNGGETGAARQKEGPKVCTCWDPCGGLGYQALGEAQNGRALGLRKGRGEGEGRTICFATVICGGWWGGLAGRCFPECFPRLWETCFLW